MYVHDPIMCGIFGILTSKDNPDQLKNIFEKCEDNISRRGPDFFSTISSKCGNWHFLFASSVLWLQGPKITKQPVETDSSIFLFNGDIFGGSIVSYEERQLFGDTKPLLNNINNGDIINVFSKAQGPYAFIYLDKINNKLYFARDTYGRRSLLIGRNSDTLLLTSVATKELPFQLIEVPALGIFCIDLNSEKSNQFTLYPWKNENQHFSEKLCELQTFLNVKVFCELCKEDELNFNVKPPENITVEKLPNLQIDKVFEFLNSDDNWRNNVKSLEELLKQAVNTRINNQPPFCSKCVKTQISCLHATVGVLFSGGIDCTLLALLADEYIEAHRPIDLLNVAFECTSGFDVPDRLTARTSLDELQKLRPGRTWNLLEINVRLNELDEERDNRICHLIYPLQSILDESLGCALWFAARGNTHDHVSTCRVLLVGMGADELFGGYTRHRAAYKRGHWPELTRVLDTDWKNISHRNLARDDRVVSDHGRQLRTPYLDETVVEFVRQLDTWEKCYPSEKIVQGLGDKLLLRALAHRLGLEQAVLLKKRALQFGSRIANSKENAHDKSPRL